jgi:hypothetical protein
VPTVGIIYRPEINRLWPNAALRGPILTFQGISKGSIDAQIRPFFGQCRFHHPHSHAVVRVCDRLSF